MNHPRIIRQSLGDTSTKSPYPKSRLMKYPIMSLLLYYDSFDRVLPYHYHLVSLILFTAFNVVDKVLDTLNLFGKR